MNQLTKNKQSGFTIIEVVLVLAIAALIFLIVFLAVPALQRSQRDTQRRNDMSRFMAQIQQYQANNKGDVPKNPTASNCAAAATGNVQKFVEDYLTAADVWNDPDTNAPYVCDASPTSDPAVGEYQYKTNATCAGEAFGTATGDRKVAVRTKLEGAGFHCLNN